jgi:hydroxyacylglutathione hydrolase
MKIHVLTALKDNFVFVLEANGLAAVIDPGEAAPVEEFLRQHDLKLTHILCTHHHHDHIGGVVELSKNRKLEVLCFESDRSRIAGSTRGLKDGEEFSLLGETLRVLHIPGHTQGQVAYYFTGHVFVGDTLFSCGCGRLFEGTPEQMWSSLRRLRELPNETRIYFGHEYTLRNIEFLKTNNDGLNLTELDRYQVQVDKLLESGLPTVPTTVEQELKVNPFFKAPDVKSLAKWRELRDTW